MATLLAQNCHLHGVPFQLFGPPSRRTEELADRFGDRVITEAGQVEEGRAWLIAVKSWQNPEKIAALRSAPRATSIMAVQNGLGPHRAWSKLSNSTVEQALCSYGVRTVRPGVVVGGETGEFVLRTGSPYFQTLTSLGFSCREVKDVEAASWHKLAVNASLNVVAALFGFTNGEVLRHHEAAGLAKVAAREVQQVAVGWGVDWGDVDPWLLTESVARQTADNVCSTLSDLRNGRPTEYSSINGEVLSRAGALRLAVPGLMELDRRFRALFISRASRPRGRATRQGKRSHLIPAPTES